MPSITAKILVIVIVSTGTRGFDHSTQNLYQSFAKTTGKDVLRNQSNIDHKLCSTLKNTRNIQGSGTFYTVFGYCWLHMRCQRLVQIPCFTKLSLNPVGEHTQFRGEKKVKFQFAKHYEYGNFESFLVIGKEFHTSTRLPNNCKRYLPR